MRPCGFQIESDRVPGIAMIEKSTISVISTVASQLNAMLRYVASGVVTILAARVTQVVDHDSPSLLVAGFEAIERSWIASVVAIAFIGLFTYAISTQVLMQIAFCWIWPARVRQLYPAVNSWFEENAIGNIDLQSEYSRRKWTRRYSTQGSDVWKYHAAFQRGIDNWTSTLHFAYASCLGAAMSPIVVYVLFEIDWLSALAVWLVSIPSVIIMVVVTTPRQIACEMIFNNKFADPIFDSLATSNSSRRDARTSERGSDI